MRKLTDAALVSLNGIMQAAAIRPTLLAILLGVSHAAVAQRPAEPPSPTDYRSSPERRVVVDKDWGPWLGPFRAKLVPSLMQDFGERYIYAAANRALPPPKPGERRVVFLGDSITDRWNLAASFPGEPYVNRGIGHSPLSSRRRARNASTDASGLPPVYCLARAWARATA